MADDDGGPLQDAPGTDVGVLGLLAGVPYVRCWADADRAAELLRAELHAWGIGDDRMVVRAHAGADGVGVVELGWVSPELAELLAGLLAQARQPASGHSHVAGGAPHAA